MDKLKPMLFSQMKGYRGGQFVKDLVAGVIVAIIALPLSIALALASGVGPEQGIYTAIVAGFVISALGGSAVQIAGPTAAFATIVAGIVARSGFEGLVAATIVAGLLLILMGVCKLGALIKYIPTTITVGFTAGIAVTIVIGQIKDFFGMSYPAGMPTVETVEKLEALFAGLDTFSVDAMIVGLVCLAVQIIMPRITQKIPGSLVAVLVGILMVQFLPLQVNTIGDLYTLSGELPKFHLPELSFELFSGALSDGFTIAILAAIESLLSCVVADGMIGGRHRSNMELVAQGAGNIASALFGGIPATGAIARTAANIKNGGRTPVAGMIHAVVLALILVVLMPYAGLIPMPTIAAILFMVAYNMCGWRTFVQLTRTAPKSDVMVLFVTFILTVVFDLVIAIEVGMLMACLLFMKRMSDETSVRGWLRPEDADEDDREKLLHIPHSVSVYEISGPLFFGAAGQISHITTTEKTRCLILRMRSVPAIDSTAMDALLALHKRCQADGITVVFSHVNEQPMNAMRHAGFRERIGEENFCAHIDEALLRAEEIVGEAVRS
ncbi:MAG: STAS domain-containing protein [Ruminococcaceae bacterium]|nr:STAS domain-containing protein [Oscillospiraceae bacterium]